jgi:hypothetical protein
VSHDVVLPFQFQWWCQQLLSHHSCCCSGSDNLSCDARWCCDASTCCSLNQSCCWCCPICDVPVLQWCCHML